MFKQLQKIKYSGLEASDFSAEIPLAGARPSSWHAATTACRRASARDAEVLSKGARGPEQWMSCPVVLACRVCTADGVKLHDTTT